MLKADYEYARFAEMVIFGLALEVGVTGVSVAKRRIRFDLKRTLPVAIRSH